MLYMLYRMPETKKMSLIDKVGNSAKCFGPLLEKGLYRSKLFPFRVDPIPKGISCAGNYTGSHKSYPPCTKWRKILNLYPVTLNYIWAMEASNIMWLTQSNQGPVVQS